jgi:hypothetical protein
MDKLRLLFIMPQRLKTIFEHTNTTHTGAEHRNLYTKTIKLKNAGAEHRNIITYNGGCFFRHPEINYLDTNGFG